MELTICSQRHKNSHYYVNLAMDQGYIVSRVDGDFRIKVLEQEKFWHDESNVYKKYNGSITVFNFKKES